MVGAHPSTHGTLDCVCKMQRGRGRPREVTQNVDSAIPAGRTCCHSLLSPVMLFMWVLCEWRRPTSMAPWVLWPGLAQAPAPGVPCGPRSRM